MELALGCAVGGAVVAVVFAAGFVWWRLTRRPPEPPPPDDPRDPAIPDRITPAHATELVAPRLAGVTLDQQPLPADARAVVWVDGPDEVVVHLDSVRIELADGVVLVALDLETDETGRATVVVPFAVGEDEAGGVLLAAEDRPRGPATLLARWGDAVTHAAYHALVDLAATHAGERSGVPKALYVRDGSLRLAADPR